MKSFPRGRMVVHVVLALAALAALGAAPGAQAALPSVVVHAVTAPLTNTAQHTGVTVTAGCPAGTLVGGGSYLRNAADPATLPTNGLVLGGQSPATGASPLDGAVADGAADPTHWFTVANFTGVADPANLDQAESFALCAAGGPAHTVVKTASTVGASDNANQQLSPPVPATATCPSGAQLIGGGAVTSTPDQVDDGTTVGNSGNLKPLASYPSDAAGAAAANGSTGATSWSAYGSAGIQDAGGGPDVVTAYALCSTDPSPPPVAVARVDVAGPVAQSGTTTTTGSAACPMGTQLVGGGYGADETVGATGGLAPQQGYHMRGSYPTATAVTSRDGTPPTELADGAANPQTWTAVLQLGGQTLPAGDFGTLHVYAMCAMTPAPPGSADLSVSLTGAPDPVVVGQPLTYTLGVANAGPAAATGVGATAALPAGLSFVSATSTVGSCAQSAGTVTCSIGGLAGGASAAVTVIATPTQAVALTATATVSGSEPDANPANNSATVTTMANLATRASPTLTAQPRGATLGSPIADAVTLAGGSSPTGTISFALYGPGDPTCKLALATSVATVAGNGTYGSAPFTPTGPGTYHWIAGYGGDGANAPIAPEACGDPSQAVSVQVVPSLSVKALGATQVGGTITGQATLAGGSVVTGAITLDLYGPGDPGCARSLATTTAAVSGNGVYGSHAFRTTAPGAYHWVAHYGGDALNVPLGPTPCAAASITVTGAAATSAAGRPSGASNAFGLTTPRADRHGRITLVATGPGRGGFRAVASVSLSVAGRRKPETIRYGSRTSAVRAAGRVTLAITPGGRAQVLRRHHPRLRVSIAITFTPTGGAPRARTTHVTVTGARR